MKLFQNIGKALSGAVSFVGEKNRKAAYLNRIRAVIRCEERAAEKEYLALGRYYYNSLRDKSNPVTEAHCEELEAIEARLDKALEQLEQFYAQEREACSVAVIGGEDGPTAVYVSGKNCCASAEEVDLDGVESYDHDPMAQERTPVAPAEPTENDGLPFEG